MQGCERASEGGRGRREGRTGEGGKKRGREGRREGGGKDGARDEGRKVDARVPKMTTKFCINVRLSLNRAFATQFD